MVCGCHGSARLEKEEAYEPQAVFVQRRELDALAGLCLLEEGVHLGLRGGGGALLEGGNWCRSAVLARGGRARARRTVREL